jgi:hypothetical protein
LDQTNKVIEDTLIKLYAFGYPPKVSKFDLKVLSAQTYTITIDIEITNEPNNNPYVGFQLVAESGNTFTNTIIENKIKSNVNFSQGNQNTNENDVINPVIKIPIQILGINYWWVNYTKLILYPKIE